MAKWRQGPSCVTSMHLKRAGARAVRRISRPSWTVPTLSEIKIIQHRIVAVGASAAYAGNQSAATDQVAVIPITENRHKSSQPLR